MAGDRNRTLPSLAGRQSRLGYRSAKAPVLEIYETIPLGVQRDCALKRGRAVVRALKGGSSDSLNVELCRHSLFGAVQQTMMWRCSGAGATEKIRDR